MKGKVYQVKTDAGLSKPYSIGNLRRKREAGYVLDAADCTADGGETWTTLGTLLAIDTNEKVRRKETESDSSESSLVSAEASGIRPMDGSASSLMVPRESGLQNSPDASAFAVPQPDLSGSAQTEAAAQDTEHLGGPQAASAVLKAASIRRRKAKEEQKTQAENSTEADLLRLQRSGRSTIMRYSLLSGLAGAFFAVSLTFAFGVIRDKLTGKAADSVADNNVDFSMPINSDPTKPMTLDELSVRSRIMSSQIGRIAREVSLDDSDMLDVNPQAANRSRELPLVSYVVPGTIDEDMAEVRQLFETYATLVQSRGADGRKLDAETVRLYVDRLSRMMALSGGREGRAAAARDLAERSKLMYLLVLYFTRSDDAALADKGCELLLAGTNQGLERLYPELRNGDMRFAEIYRAVPDEERRALILIRYLYHRSKNAGAADQWLQALMDTVSDDAKSYLSASIEEVNRIEHGES